MKLYAILAGLLMLVGAFPALLLAPINLIADGIAALVTGVPWWMLAAAVSLAVLQNRKPTKPRVRVVKGHATPRKAA